MTPFLHAAHTAHRWGGTPADFMAVHVWIDQSKGAWADPRHRAFLHHREGADLCARVVATTPSGTRGVRDVAEDHIREDLGFLPAVSEWFSNLRPARWMTTGKRTARDHATANAKQWGGSPEAYLPLHAFLDGGTDCPASSLTRAWLHHCLGVHLAVAVFGEVLRPAPALQIPVRELVEDHLRHDCGHRPSLIDWYSAMDLQPWMFRAKSARQAVCDLSRAARRAAADAA